MHCFEMQDWLTIRASSTLLTVTQSEHAWLDLSEYRDVVLWTEVKELTINTGGLVSITFTTCPTQDEELFARAVAPFLATPGVTASVVHTDSAPVALARWLRWQLLSSGATAAWDVTFRVWASAAGKGSRR
jgi:hypothetical protein